MARQAAGLSQPLRFPVPDHSLPGLRPGAALHLSALSLDRSCRKRTSGPRYHFDDEVRLEYYRLQKISEGSISLSEGTGQAAGRPARSRHRASARRRRLPLSRLIDMINERFGTDFTEADQLFFDQIIEAAIDGRLLREAAAVNPEDKFSLLFSSLLETLFIERMEQNEDIFARFMNEKTSRTW